MKTLKRISALLLALLLAASFSITAFAAESVTEPVTANDGQEKVVGDVNVTSEIPNNYENAVSVQTNNSNGQASVTADSVTVISNNDDLIKVLDVKARGENSNASAHVNKNVTVTNNANGIVEVIDVYANAANSTASVQVDGIVTIDKGGTGIIASTGTNGGTANVSVTGSVTAGGTGISANGNAGKASVSAGSVTAGDGYAIYATNVGGGETLVNITDAATSQNGTGIHARTFLNNASKTTVTAGSVTAGGTGIEAVAEYGTTTVTVGTGTGENFSAGNVTAGGTGISAVSKTGGTTNITAGDITADNAHVR